MVAYFAMKITRTEIGLTILSLNKRKYLTTWKLRMIQYKKDWIGSAKWLGLIYWLDNASIRIQEGIFFFAVFSWGQPTVVLFSSFNGFVVLFRWETKMVGSISVLVVFKDTNSSLAMSYLPNFFLLGPYLLCVSYYFLEFS